LYLKKYFDKKYPIQFIVSGSAASFIEKGSESLAGRTVEKVIRPFSFYEYIDYSLRDKKLKENIDGLREEFNFKRLPSKDNLIPYETQIKIVFEEYLNRGGFPQLFRFIHTAAELGIPGLMAYLAVLAGAGCMCITMWKKGREINVCR